MLAYPKKPDQRYVVVKKNGGGLRSCLAALAVGGLCLLLFAVTGVAVYALVSAASMQRCPDAEAAERKWRAAEDRAERLEAELVDVRRKHRVLEDDFRELAIASRSAHANQQQQQQQQQAPPPKEDMSALQRLGKCRASVEASTEAIKELREHNTDLNKQMTRLQREVKDAVKDADDSERALAECNRRLQR